MLSNRVRIVFEKYNGTLPTKLAEEHDINKETLRKAYLRGDVEKTNRGVYVLPETIDDTYFSTQIINSKGIYSHESALMLLNYTTFIPHKYYMTFPQGYNNHSFADKLIQPTMIKKEFYELGVIELETWQGNKVRSYNKERTILDMIDKYTLSDGLVNEMLEYYQDDEDTDLEKLIKYAKLMDREVLLEGIEYIFVK